MNSAKRLTVVTPTYNRACVLYKCYESLVNQTSNDFIWMIVDDGSTDDTKNIVDRWTEDNKIEILYYKKSNGGKASALNFALEKVNTEYWVCLDSDDTFSRIAVKMAINELEKIRYDSRYCGLIALRNAPNGEVLGGKRIPVGIDEATIMEIYDRYKIRSEFIQFYKTKITSEYRFPIIPGEKFISPEYFSKEINRKYKFKISQETYCYCEYLPDGLTRRKIDVIKKNPKGYTLIMLQGFELSETFIMRSKRCLNYIAGCMLSNDKDCIQKSPHKLMTILYYPLGWLVYRIRFKNK